MKFNIEHIKKQAAEDYEKAWTDTRKLFPETGHLFDLQKKSRLHPMFTLIAEMRQKLADMGFEEIQLPMIIEEAEVYKEYGPEAALILDRLFYLAELPRPEIGLSKKREEEILKIVPNFTQFDALRRIFREYKAAEIEADDILEIMVTRLNLKETEASSIIDRVFPEFKNLTPVPTKKTLRSHTTALWFPVLAALQNKKPLPLQYFHIGPKFRREQRLDTKHLYVSNTISIVVMAEEMSIEDAKRIAQEICRIMGFEQAKAEMKTATSKYYAPQTEFEIFVQHPQTQEWLEIGDGGFYSPVACANYGIEYPVLNIGFGVERVTMIRTGETDIRRLVHPYFYDKITFSDEDLGSTVKYTVEPHTDAGKALALQVENVVQEKKDLNSPVEIPAWEGQINGRTVKVTLWEKDPNVKLVGPAIFNEIWVKDGNILGLDKNKPHTGVKTNATYLGGLAARVGNLAEELSAKKGAQVGEVRVKMAKRPSDVNIDLAETARLYITSEKKKFDIRGPVFFGARVEIEE